MSVTSCAVSKDERVAANKKKLGPVMTCLPAMLLLNVPAAIVFSIAAALRSGNFDSGLRSTSNFPADAL